MVTETVNWKNFGHGLTAAGRSGTALGRIQNWGVRGATQAALRGGLAAYGFYPSQTTGKFAFLGGAPVGQALKGAGLGMAMGYGVYKATDNPLLGLGAGIATAKLIGTPIMKFANPVFGVYSMIEGFREGGFGGGIKAAAGYGISWALFDVGMGAIGAAFKGSALAQGVSRLGGLGSLATGVAVAAAIGIGTYKIAQHFAARGRRAMLPEFVGKMGAFQTEAAYTMRQRALQEISRSHVNSRTILGNEATLLHL